MTFARILPLALAALALASLAPADTITSTSGGGLWTDPATWIGGTVPGITDEVVIAGPVHVGGIQSCQSLTIQAGGAVIGASAGSPRRLEVQGAVINQGIIDDGPYTLELTVGGDLVNGGAWVADKTYLTGGGDREIRDASGNGFVTDLRSQSGAGGDLLATTPLSIAGQVDITGMRLVLDPGSHLDLPETIWVGDIAAGGNEIRFASWSYLSQSTIDDAVLVGVARAAMAVHFTTRLEVRDQLENPTSTGGGAAIIEGDLVNHGLIRNVNYSFFFQVHGDVENHGVIAVPNLEFMGAGVTHRLHMGPEAILDSTVFLPEFQAATLIAETPVTFGDGLGLGVGTLVLEPGASLHFGTHSGLGSGHVEANGNLVTTSTGNSGLSQCSLDQAVFGDYAAVHGEIHLSGGATVLGTLTSWPWAAADLTVQGRLRVEGTVTDGDHEVRIVATGDVENLGVMDNARLLLDAVVDQAVGIGPGIAVPEIVLASHVEAASYQWYRDGEALPGETGANLTFATLGLDDLGAYHCLADGNVLRQITIVESLDATDVPVPTVPSLAQNHPNPFNPATEIAFTLDRAGPVSLVVYDLAGRAVERLVGAELGAGRHAVTWRPRGLASGVYVYRLRAPGVDQARKCSLLK